MGLGFLEALATDKVTVYFERLKEITEDGFIDQDGQKHEVDVIICATGWAPFAFTSALYPQVCRADADSSRQLRHLLCVQDSRVL